jgi:hypothetical protein
MSVMSFLRPVAAIVAASTLTDATRVLTSDPKEVAYMAGAGTVTIDLDLGSVQEISAVFIGAMSSALTFTVTGGAAAYTTESAGSISVADKLKAVAPRRNFALFAPKNWRYIRLEATGAPAGLEIGNVVVGDAFQPTWGHEWGAGRGVGDTGTAQRLLSGGFGINRGARFKTWDWTLGDITDAEVRELTDLCLTVGETAPLVICEDPDQTAGLDERLYYGKFAKLERYERLVPGATRWSFKVEEWV